MEPGIIKIFNMKIKISKLNDKEVKVDARFLGMKDDVFTMDRASYKEKKTMGSNGLPKYKMYAVDTGQYNDAIVSAFSINWPFLAFGGLHNYIILFNAYDKEYVHRVQMAQEGDKLTIYSTQMTDTNDLFVVTYKKDTYYLTMFDLEASDMECLS